MCYIITDGERYINSTGGQHVVSNLNQATKFKMDKANNVLQCIPKILKKYNWKIEYASVENKIIVSIPQVKEIGYNLLDKVNDLETFVKDIQERNLYLQAKLHTVELEIVDIEHAAEFYNLNAAQGYKLYKILHDRQNSRREIKDEMEKIQYILNGTMKGALNNNISKSINGLNNRQYTPRVLKELFNV